MWIGQGHFPFRNSRYVHCAIRGCGASMQRRFGAHDWGTKGSWDADATLSSTTQNVMDKAELGLGSSEMAELLAEADVSGDGEIDYNEFVPIAVQVVEAMYARDNVSSEAAEQRQDIADYLLHGLTPSELEEVMAGVFRKADVDGSGTLSLAEFHKCIRDADLGLTRKEINHLMFSADFNGNKQLSWQASHNNHHSRTILFTFTRRHACVASSSLCTFSQEFVPLCFDILVEVMRSELRSSQPPSVVETKLVEIFRGADDANSGSLPFDDVRDLLQAADLGLTRLQVR